MVRGLSLKLIFTLSALLLVAAAEAQPESELETPHFAFYSDLRVNLHDTLLLADRAELPGEADEQACFDGLAPSAAAGWEAAKAFYNRIVAPHQWGDSQHMLIRVGLTDLRPMDERELEYLSIVEGMLAAATPAYEACLWPAQQTQNRLWIEAVARQLENHADAIAKRLEALYATPWHGLPLRVDVVPNAPPRGANSIILSPSGGHIYVSSTVPSRLALEIVFHEASHTITAPWRPDPVPAMLQAAAEAQAAKLPRDLWHVVLFYLTGSTVKDQLAAAGEPGYTMYMEERQLWNGRWGPYREAIDAVVPRYMDGSLKLEDMAQALIKRLELETAAAQQ